MDKKEPLAAIKAPRNTRKEIPQSRLARVVNRRHFFSALALGSLNFTGHYEIYTISRPDYNLMLMMIRVLNIHDHGHYEAQSSKSSVFCGLFVIASRQ